MLTGQTSFGSVMPHFCRIKNWPAKQKYCFILKNLFSCIAKWGNGVSQNIPYQWRVLGETAVFSGLCTLCFPSILANRLLSCTKQQNVPVSTVLLWLQATWIFYDLTCFVIYGISVNTFAFLVIYLKALHLTSQNDWLTESLSDKWSSWLDIVRWSAIILSPGYDFFVLIWAFKI